MTSWPRNVFQCSSVSVADSVLNWKIHYGNTKQICAGSSIINQIKLPMFWPSIKADTIP